MIIVDDEKIICDGLKKFINENCCCFNVSDSFYSADSALEYIKNNDVDLILTDIKMPNISGLDMIEKIRKVNDKIQIIILSGFSDFPFLQRAIYSSVFSYLLKPVDNDNLLDELSRAAEKISSIKQAEFSEKQSKELLEDLREMFFVELLFGSAGSEAYDRYNKLYFGTDFDCVNCHILSFEKEDKLSNNGWKYGKESIKTSICNFFYLECKDVIYSLCFDQNHILLLLQSSENINDIINNFRDWFNQFFGEKILINEVFSCVGAGNLPYYSKQKVSVLPDENILTTRFMLLNTYIKLNMLEDARLLYNNLLDYCLSFPRENALKYILDMFSIISIDDLNFSVLIHKSSSIVQTCNNCFNEVLEHHRRRQNNEVDIIKKIKEYVGANYSSDVTLENIGANIYMNPVYLSRYFKQQTGEKFSSYLLSVRMTNAIRLLKENKYKIYEIAELVGYHTSRHFMKQFKLFTGYTPKQYCKSVWSISISDD